MINLINEIKTIFPNATIKDFESKTIIYVEDCKMNIYKKSGDIIIKSAIIRDICDKLSNIVERYWEFES